MLKYKEHTEDCWTERETFYHDDPIGDLVYDSLEGTTIERTDEGLRIKVRISKMENWLQAADLLSCEVRIISDWAHKLRRAKKTFADLEVLERDPEIEQLRERLYYKDNDTFLYMYFYDELNWVMYDNDDEYLFMFDLTYDNNYLMATGMDALGFTPYDCLCGVCSWMRRWYDRVNGYPEYQQ